jgi:hypothetical protein
VNALRYWKPLAGTVFAVAVAVGCGSSDDQTTATGGSGGGGAGGTDGGATGGTSQGGSANGGSANGGSSNGGSANGGSSNGGSANGGSSNGGSGGTAGSGGSSAGWLHTVTGDNKIYDSNNSVWVGRGVNIDDLFFGGYNCSFWMSDGDAAMMATVDVLMSSWKPTFVRVNLSMSGVYNVSTSTCPGAVLANWTDPIASNTYKATMTKAIEALGNAGAYVLVTLRTDETMIRYASATTTEPCDCSGSCDTAVCVPTAATDAVYQALVDSFWDKPYVMFGASNEGGGFNPDSATLRTLMSHVVDVIRAQEATHGGQPHLISVQSTGYTSTSSYYSTNPLSQSNVVYEHHGYPPTDYMHSNIPIIIGEYGPSDMSGSNVSDLSGLNDNFETQQISNLAWIFEPINGVTPPLASGWSGVAAANMTETNLQLTSWGTLVKNYLLAH